MAFNPYDGMTYYERQRVTNAIYRNLTLRNLIEQQQNLEKISSGDVDEGTDVSGYLNVINESFRSVNNNISRLKSFIMDVKSPGAILKNPQKIKGYPGDVPPVVPEEPDPADYLLGPAGYQQDLADYEQAVQDLADYNAAMAKYNETLQQKVYSSVIKNFFEKFVDTITKLNYNLSLIIENTKLVVKVMLDEGEENFNFSSMKNTYDLFNIFQNEYDKFLQEFGFYDVLNNAGEVIGKSYILKDDLQSIAGKKIKGLERLSASVEYIDEFNSLCEEIIRQYKIIRKASIEKGSSKVQYGGASLNTLRKFHWMWL